MKIVPDPRSPSDEDAADHQRAGHPADVAGDTAHDAVVWPEGVSVELPSDLDDFVAAKGN